MSLIIQALNWNGSSNEAMYETVWKIYVMLYLPLTCPAKLNLLKGLKLLLLLLLLLLLSSSSLLLLLLLLSFYE